MNKVLFVGTYDVYRSKFAALYFNSQCVERKLKYKAFSVGFQVDPKKSNIDPQVLDYLGYMGVITEEDDHRASKINEVYLESCQKVICMDMEEHLTFMRQHFPVYVRRSTYWHYSLTDGKSKWTTLPLIKKEIDHFIASLQLVGAV